MKRECPYCKQELSYHDWFYTGNHAAYEKGYEGSGFKKLGDIYKCGNEDCDSQSFNYSFYTRIGSDELLEGYPC